MMTGSSLSGGTCINDAGHTIRGAGWINANFENRGLIIADGGELAIERYSIYQSATGTLTTAGPGNILTLSYNLNLYGGRVYPNGGQVAFKGVYVFDGTNFGPGDVNVMTGSFNGDITTAADMRITRGRHLIIS